MLWKIRISLPRHAEKAGKHSVFRFGVIHREWFSTAVDNFVENDTHAEAFA